MAGHSPVKMRRAAEHIVNVDPAFEEIVASSPLCTIGSRKYLRSESHFETLVKSVCSQQLSVKAADTIIERLYVAADRDVSPTSIAAMRPETLREAGLSNAKVRTIQEMGLAVLSGELDLEALDDHEHNDLIVDELTKLWGIGRWTAEMFMMFKLYRLDVWPVGDLAMRRGWERIHRMRTQIDPKVLDRRADKLSPYRSVVAWYCWRMIDDGTSDSW